uniref:Uncharacterized protein n=1 Tax=Myotis myotis TaxID=51298 RepID=A0A7J7R2R2_MYOMY|nr:hypothetical protein mMyoMyo1_010927 [Myotis myotis]
MSQLNAGCDVSHGHVSCLREADLSDKRKCGREGGAHRLHDGREEATPTPRVFSNKPLPALALALARALLAHRSTLSHCATRDRLEDYANSTGGTAFSHRPQSSKREVVAAPGGALTTGCLFESRVPN